MLRDGSENPGIQRLVMAEIEELRSNLANYKVQLQQVGRIFALFVWLTIDVRCKRTNYDYNDYQF